MGEILQYFWSLFFVFVILILGILMRVNPQLFLKFSIWTWGSWGLDYERLIKSKEKWLNAQRMTGLVFITFAIGLLVLFMVMVSITQHYLCVLSR